VVDVDRAVAHTVDVGDGLGGDAAAEAALECAVPHLRVTDEAFTGPTHRHLRGRVLAEGQMQALDGRRAERLGGAEQQRGAPGRRRRRGCARGGRADQARADSERATRAGQAQSGTTVNYR
jgi:hypothetical protein